MCGIFGVVTNEKGLKSGQVKSLTRTLLKVSESRGKESAGITVLAGEEIRVFKLPKPAHVLKNSSQFNELFVGRPQAVIGHARLVTNGSLEDNQNNQPVIKDGIVGIHNGIVVNVDELWKKHPYLKRKYEVDTEVILSLVRYYYEKSGDLEGSIKKTFDEIEGAASIALVFADLNAMAIATNTGSMYLAKGKNQVVFASEYNFLKKTLPSSSEIKQVSAGEGFILDLANLKKYYFSLERKSPLIKINEKKRQIVDQSFYSSFQPPQFEIKATDKIKTDFEKLNKKISKLKRCTRCILPETVPFIEFDKEGVCNYCRNFQKIKPKGRQSLEETVKKFRRQNKPDCLVTFSGGRDSSYGLHYLKRVLKMNPITYTYDWGMITDLGRRNQARMTGKLGVEQILISADIKKKREYIRKNVLAWLKKPDLGTVPLFMAGDKQYFYYANKVAKELGISLIILCINPFEKTEFKSGFCGVRPNAEVIYRINFQNKMKMAMHYAKAYLTNQAYINTSLIDTFSAFVSYYFIPHQFLSFYEYINWDEEQISKTLREQYNWEVAGDTSTTWRIGDGTAPFYNYIYYVLAGFTENDTFRSNQIRQGAISREQALERSSIENHPRWESIQWYCDTIGIDSKKALEIINKQKKRY